MIKIANIKQCPMIEIRKYKKCLGLEGFGH